MLHNDMKSTLMMFYASRVRLDIITSLFNKRIQEDHKEEGGKGKEHYHRVIVESQLIDECNKYNLLKLGYMNILNYFC